ncbi:hypothetical protein SASPL_127903 [Salvia splendens]|uniref:Uncharacterized protein n=1 Tax=Salvia splendens TaxID=180675 RepID=A0A8X8XE20_SALSN|nr:hypothetical protein SASPL_127903 [Salvia splendens]
MPSKMLVIESVPAAAFCAGTFRSPGRILSHSAAFFIRRNSWRSKAKSVTGVRATAKDQSGSDFGPVKPNAKPQRYHPSEEIGESAFLESGGEAILTPAETTRTIIEVNSKATLMFSGVISEEVHENIFWPDLPYVTDEYGNIYFQVKNDEDILQTLTSEETVVDWVSILDEEDQGEESDGSLGDWAKLETMRSSHPVYFAKKLADVSVTLKLLDNHANIYSIRYCYSDFVVSDDPVDFMEQPAAGLAIQGLLRPAFIEEHPVIQKQISGPESYDVDADHNDQQFQGHVQINGETHDEDEAQENPNRAENLEKDENVGNGFAFYKLEMIKIQLVSALGHQSYVEIEDFGRAQPDAIAHSAAKIISRLKAGGEKTTQALNSLCWRCKGIQVEECALIGVDSLGFDVRVCSGIQVQTLRFAFKKKASSEYSAERQLNDLLFPRTQKFQQKKEAQQTET